MRHRKLNACNHAVALVGSKPFHAGSLIDALWLFVWGTASNIVLFTVFVGEAALLSYCLPLSSAFVCSRSNPNPSSYRQGRVRTTNHV